MEWLIFLFVTIISIVCFRYFMNIYEEVSSNYQSPVPAKTLIILGSGGHTQEIISMISSLRTSLFSPRLYVASNSDNFSLNKAKEMESKREATDYLMRSITRAREVGQSWISSIFTTAWALFQSTFVVVTYKPDLIICNGPGVCVPICLIAFALRKLAYLRVKIVFVESLCRVNTLSLSGRILKHVADEFLVQWRHMESEHRNTKFIGRVS